VIVPLGDIVGTRGAPADAGTEEVLSTTSAFTVSLTWLDFIGVQAWV
jgi:hypothetical protein